MERVAKERLIIAVRPYECLWNKNNVDFLNQNVKRDSWKSVINVLDPAWKNKPKAAQLQQLKLYQKLWMGICGHYRRQKRNGKLDGLLSKQKASYCKMLTFLDIVEEGVQSEDTGCEKLESNENEIETIEYLETDIEEEQETTRPRRRRRPTSIDLEALSHNLSQHIQPAANIKVPLIAAMKSHECLWNVNVEGYTQPILRRKAWLEVGKAIGQGWDSLTSAEQEQLVKAYQNKWHNIRYYYRKLKRSGLLKRRWKRNQALYLKNLSFLDDHEDHTDEEILTSDSDEGNEAAEHLQGNYEKVEMPLSASETVNNYEVIQMPANTTKAVKNFEVVQMPVNTTEATLTPLETNLISLLQNRPDKEENMDADRHFLLSLLPEVKNLSADESLEFKVAALNAIKDIKSRRREQNKDEDKESEVQVQVQE